MKYLAGLVAAIAAALSGCGSVPVESARSGAAKLAVLTQPSAATSKALNAAINQALNGTKVSLAGDVFTRSHQLTLERNAQDPVGMAGLNGRLLGVPEAQRFSLLLRGQQCYLRHENKGREYALGNVRCQLL